MSVKSQHFCQRTSAIGGQQVKPNKSSHLNDYGGVSCSAVINTEIEGWATGSRLLTSLAACSHNRKRVLPANLEGADGEDRGKGTCGPFLICEEQTVHLIAVSRGREGSWPFTNSKQLDILKRSANTLALKKKDWIRCLERTQTHIHALTGCVHSGF